MGGLFARMLRGVMTEMVEVQQTFGVDGVCESRSVRRKIEEGEWSEARKAAKEEAERDAERIRRLRE